MLLETTVTWLSLISLCNAAYCIKDDYLASGTNFFDNFDFFTDDDYTHGYVNYVNRSTASARGLINTNNGVYMGVDKTNVASGRGRDSVRITSKKSYQYGLFILDMAHMPGGACGEWPAFWTVGPNWPNSGEIDIIEGVNSQTSNTMAIHTTSGCSIQSRTDMTGSMIYPNCDINAANQPGNSGCVIATSSTSTYGAGFNAVGGGVYAMEWQSGGVKIYIFNRNNIPSDITSGKPIPARWGNPVARFALPCQFVNYLNQQQIVFDITFCGDWAGAVWSSDSTCAPLASTCQSYVQNNPSAFSNSYWAINSFKVYQDDGRGLTATCLPTTTSQGPQKRAEPTAWTPNYGSPANILAQPQIDREPQKQQSSPPIAHREIGEEKQYSDNQGNIVPRNAMAIVDEDDFYSPHEHLEEREALAFAEPNPLAEPEPEPEPMPVAEPIPEPEALPEPEPESNATLEEPELDDEAFDKRQGPYVGPNGIVQAGQARPVNGRPANQRTSTAVPGPAAFAGATKITVTVTSTVYSGRTTSTVSNRVNPTTMMKTTSTRPPAAQTPRPNANVNLMQANAFGGARGGQGQQRVTTRTASATLTLTKSLGARNAAPAAAAVLASPKPKVKKPRSWYEDRDESQQEVSEADVNIVTDIDNESSSVEPDLDLDNSAALQERLYILPDDLEDFTGGGAHRYHHDEIMDEDADWEELFGPSGVSSGDHDHAHDLGRKEHTHAIPHQHQHQHRHHQHHHHPHRHHHHHPHSHNHPIEQHDTDHTDSSSSSSNEDDDDTHPSHPDSYHTHHDDSEEHYYNGHDLASHHPDMTPQRLLKEMQRRRAEEKKAAQLRAELAEIELRRVKEMLGRRHRHVGAGAGGRGRKGWW